MHGIFSGVRSDFEAFNIEYAKHFSRPFPVRTTVCAELVDDVLVEITVIASDCQL